ncbi:uncharacterized protein EURHEDRAFT_549225 [Aspergillus ruber CBS 135680]|uniref:Uncharacterized protein n=1 Tax=Aspergillus ruber (strain CBS 135680) TaxID=1388766 RepID=A0A017S0W6_ASPRC|nr:uncharacterized protein EURHEDRAFT_549225 [Aspergillus ruber CBS 135680]EYE90552.1 hypothetical protein EURHEDRAFT_549225 [Aspergillus ruber CBS 135680]
MDGDGQNFRNHDQPIYPSRFGMGRRAVSRQSNGGATDRFRQTGALPSARGDATMLSQATGSVQMPSSYVDYGYTDTSFPGGNQLQPYPQEQNSQPQQQRQQQQPTFSDYEQEVIYSIQQQGPPHDSFSFVPQYPVRQPAATIEALSSQFAVPQYFPAGEPTETGVGGLVSPYLNTHFPPATYPPPDPVGNPSASAQPFPTTMADLTNPLRTAAGQQQQPPPPLPQAQAQPQQSAANPATTTSHLEDAYSQYQRAIRATLDYSREGRLVKAGQSILEISEWILTNAEQLGIFRDDVQIYPYQMHLWNNFNICWLSVCQMQKDLTQEIIQSGQQRPHVSLISAEYLDHMGKQLIRLCDQVEEHGLVDYQIGFWEEEILSALSQCLDLMESRPEIWHTRPMATPATAASRS